MIYLEVLKTNEDQQMFPPLIVTKKRQKKKKNSCWKLFWKNTSNFALYLKET